MMEVDGSIRPFFFHPKIGNIGTGSLEDAINFRVRTGAPTHVERRPEPNQSALCLFPELPKRLVCVTSKKRRSCEEA